MWWWPDRARARPVALLPRFGVPNDKRAHAVQVAGFAILGAALWASLHAGVEFVLQSAA